MNIKDKTVLLTGANRGLGKALVEEALERGAKRVYAASRTPITYADERVVSLTVDITNADRIQEGAKEVESLDILINNAGVALYGDLNERKLIEQHLAVNLFGMQDMAQAFLPLVTATTLIRWEINAHPSGNVITRGLSQYLCRCPHSRTTASPE